MSYRVREDHKLEAALPFHEPAPYDVSNSRLSACVDGTSLNKLSLSGAYEAVLPGGFYGTCGMTAPDTPDAEKTVTAYGRVQQTQFAMHGISYSVTWFCGSDKPVLYLRVYAQSKKAFTLQYHFGVQCAPEKLNVLCTASLVLREREGDYLHYSASVKAAAAQDVYFAELTLAFDLGHTLTQSSLLSAAEDASADAEAYFAMLLSVSAPEEDAAFKAYALNAAFSSYKSFAGFSGFFAGVNYAAPARTYYRDGYYTALSLLPYRPQWVKEQLFMLARGVAPDGTCGSAVDAGGKPWWNDHADSPLFFALLLYAYVAATGDADILGKQKTTQKLAAVLERTASLLDDNGLIPRFPASRHDWADNVFREGYVTYIQCLAYGALKLGGSLLPDAARYAQFAEQIKAGVNRVLWDEALGYYVNFQAPGETEKNLSIDTVFAVLFDIASPERAKRMLEQMETLLETKQNGRYGEFGTLCVYPPYASAARLVEKSADPLRYHNGADWPYLSALYAFAKKLCGMDYLYPLTRWFEVGLQHGFATPVEYFSPYYPAGGFLQGWSAFAAFVLDHDSADGVFR
ncbi:MAG: amylo-alpha-1,6-glucosidase [Clostridiaceae bacterium]